MSRELDFSGAAAVREGYRFDELRLARWLSKNIEGFEGPLTVQQFKGGQSNPTYKLITPRKSYVLRRKPSGKLLEGAHAVEREARVMQALMAADFPVPHIHVLCTDNSVVGSWFYVMDCVDGRIMWDITFPSVTRADRPRYFDAMNETIARLHTVDYAAIGLSDYGKHGSYFERQIARWSRQYIGDLEAGRDPHLDKLVEWLPVHIPQVAETSIVHGDFRVDNLVFHPTEPRILAVLDWELSTLGHPLADFAYHLMMYRMPLSMSGLVGADLKVLNILTEADYVAAYCRRTNRESIPHLDFYIAFNMFRAAAICHGIKGRIARGTAASDQASKMVEALPAVAKLAWEQAQAARS